MEKEEKLLSLCVSKKLTVGIAESCTGGAVSAKLTSVPGASQYFLGAIIAYSNFVKKTILKVSEDTLDKYTAVSQEVASEMVRGIQDIMDPWLSVSITGIAGPTGGTEPKPLGLVYLGLGLRSQATKIITLQLKGTRHSIIQETVDQALTFMLDALS